MSFTLNFIKKTNNYSHKIKFANNQKTTQIRQTKNKIKIKNNMKFSTSLTLAAITLMSTTGSTNARLGGASCQNDSQCINHLGNGFTCQNVRLGGAQPVYRCAPAPTPDEGVSCTNPDNYNPTYTPQCINVGSGGYTCKNVRMGGVAEYRCVPPPATAAPTSQQPIPCHYHNPTHNPECPSGYTCKPLMGANPNTYDGQCMEDIYD